ncbi:MAG: tail fiber domain-containing protein [Saprospiraceae bacterium]
MTAGADNTTGNANVAIGNYALRRNETGSFNTSVGYDSGPPSASYPNLENSTALGYNAAVTGSNTVRIGGSAVTSIGGQVNWTALSDSRIKTHIAENIPGLAFIQRLRPVSYHYDIHRQNELVGIVDTAQWEGKYDIEKIQFSGFLAQEVEQAAREVGYDFSGVDAPRNERSLYGLRYAEFTVPLVKAVQEQQQIIEAQRQQLELQGKLLAGLAARLEALEAAGRSVKVENR